MSSQASHLTNKPRNSFSVSPGLSKWSSLLNLRQSVLVGMGGSLRSISSLSSYSLDTSLHTSLGRRPLQGPFWGTGLGSLSLVNIFHEQSIFISHCHIPAWARVLFSGLLVAGHILSWRTWGECRVLSSSCLFSLLWKTCGGHGVLESKPKPVVSVFTSIQTLVN